jgi:hypothetical protein
VATGSRAHPDHAPHDLGIGDAETAQEWLRRKVSPTEPGPARARQYVELMAIGLWHPRDDEPVELKVSDNRDYRCHRGKLRVSRLVLAPPFSLRRDRKVQTAQPTLTTSSASSVVTV